MRNLKRHLREDALLAVINRRMFLLPQGIDTKPAASMWRHPVIKMHRGRNAH